MLRPWAPSAESRDSCRESARCRGGLSRNLKALGQAGESRAVIPGQPAVSAAPWGARFVPTTTTTPLRDSLPQPRSSVCDWRGKVVRGPLVLLPLPPQAELLRTLESLF